MSWGSFYSATPIPAAQPEKGLVTRMPKKLYRINEGKMLCGVCTGLADYFALDVSIVRLIFVVASFAGGTGIIAYIAAAFIIPEKPVV